jgi:hypothetical protein
LGGGDGGCFGAGFAWGFFESGGGVCCCGGAGFCGACCAAAETMLPANDNVAMMAAVMDRRLQILML